MGCGKSKHQDVAIGNAISKSRNAKSTDQSALAYSNSKKNGELTAEKVTGKSPVVAVVPDSPAVQSPVEPVVVPGAFPFQGIIADDIKTVKSPSVETVVPNIKAEESAVETVVPETKAEESPVEIVNPETKPEVSPVKEVVVEEAPPVEEAVISDTKPTEEQSPVAEAVISDTKPMEEEPLVEEAVISETKPEENSTVVTIPTEDTTTLVEDASTSEIITENSLVENTILPETTTEEPVVTSETTTSITPEEPVVTSETTSITPEVTGEKERVEKTVEEEKVPEPSDDAQTTANGEEENIKESIIAPGEEIPINKDDANDKSTEKKEEEEETN